MSTQPAAPGPNARTREEAFAPTAQQQRYLRAMERTGTLTAGCRAAKVSHHTVQAWRDEPGFAEAETIAREAFADALEQEAIRRAWRGTKNTKQVFYRGESVGEEIKVEYSDTLMVLMLKALRPDKYRERMQAELSGPGGGPISLATRFEDLSDDELDAHIAALETRAAAAGGAARGEGAAPPGTLAPGDSSGGIEPSPES